MAACVNGADYGAAQTEHWSVSKENHPENHPDHSTHHQETGSAVTYFIHAGTFSDLTLIYPRSQRKNRELC